jgi:hypothetical protein
MTEEKPKEEKPKTKPELKPKFVFIPPTSIDGMPWEDRKIKR